MLALAWQSLVAFGLGYVLPHINRVVGTRRMFYLAQITYMLLMLSTAWKPVQSKWGVVGLVTLGSTRCLTASWVS